MPMSWFLSTFKHCFSVASVTILGVCQGRIATPSFGMKDCNMDGNNEMTLPGTSVWSGDVGWWVAARRHGNLSAPFLLYTLGLVVQLFILLSSLLWVLFHPALQIRCGLCYLQSGAIIDRYWRVSIRPWCQLLFITRGLPGGPINSLCFVPCLFVLGLLIYVVDPEMPHVLGAQNPACPTGSLWAFSFSMLPHFTDRLSWLFFNCCDKTP